MEKTLFGKSERYYKDRGAIFTATEISQQPDTWRKVADYMLSKKAEITKFMDEVMSIKDLRIIFSGAGSSAFIGEAMMFLLANELGIRTEAVHSTDIVSAPESTLFDVPTLLISYGRSGESPESKAAISFASKRIKNLYNIVIVCNSNSTLADMGRRMEKSMVLEDRKSVV